MCRLCQTKPVYEFTNKRKVCARCFIKWFQKKVLFTIRKFKMISHNNVIVYEKKNDFRNVVLEDVLKMYAEKSNISLIKLHSPLARDINKKMFNKEIYNKSDNKHYYISDVFQRKILTKSDLELNKFQTKRGKSEREWEEFNKRNNFKIALASTTDSIANRIVHILIQGDASKLKQFSPTYKKTIEPLCLFLDKEVLLYAKLKKLKFKEQCKDDDEISKFINELEQKHPEIKRAVVNYWMKIKD